MQRHDRVEQTQPLADFKPLVEHLHEQARRGIRQVDAERCAVRILAEQVQARPRRAAVEVVTNAVGVDGASAIRN